MLVQVLQLLLKITELSVVPSLAAGLGTGKSEMVPEMGVTNGQPGCPLEV